MTSRGSAGFDLVLVFMTLRNLEALDSISVERAEAVEIVHDAVVSLP